MRRIMVLVTVALVMAAMMALFSTGAVAEPSCAAAPPATGTLAGPSFGPAVSEGARFGGEFGGQTFGAHQEFGHFVAQGSMCSPQNG